MGDDYKVLAEGLKDRGNDAMNNNDVEGAIELYTQVSGSFINSTPRVPPPSLEI